MLFLCCVGRRDVNHRFGASPPLLRKMEESAGIVVDDVQAPLPRADVEVEVRCDGEGGPADFRPGGAWYEVEDAVIIAGLGEKADKALRLTQIHGMVFALACSRWRSANGASWHVGSRGLNMLAVAAQADPNRWPERIAGLDCAR